MLPSAQIEVGAKTLQGLVGTYTDPGGHYWKVTYASSGASKMHYISGNPNNIVADSQPWADTASETSAPANGGAGGQYAVDASSSGSVTATLTWVPAAGQGAADPAPKCVVVRETASASAANGNNAGGAYQADDGLGDTPQTGPTSASSSGTRYTVQDGTSGVVTLTGVTLTAKTPGYVLPITGGYATASVSYQVAGQSLEVVLSGGIGPKNAKRYLIGQQCSATLSPGGLTPSNFHWTASGGDPFKNWTASDANAHFTGMGTETGSSLICYFKKPDTATVTCTVDLAVPAGAKPVGGFPGTVVSQQLSVEKPNSKLDVYIGAVTDLPSSSNPSYIQLQRFFYPTPSGDARGIKWLGAVTTPSDYIVSNDVGQWNWTQLITPGRQLKRNGTWLQIAMAQPSPAPPLLVYGVQCLDNFYPYAYSWYPANGNANGDFDSPWQQFGSDPLITAWDIIDHFDDYFMYQPPGSGSLPVPLEKVVWYWEGHATRGTTGAWTTSGKNAQWSFAGDFPSHPEWNITFYNNNITYVP